MSPYLSINEIKSIFKTYSENDPNIKSFGFGQLFNENGEPKQSQVYPGMWVNPLSSLPNMSEMGMITLNRNIQICFYDIKLSDSTNEVDIISDCEEYALRFTRWLRNANDPEINILQTPTITPFTDKFLDDVAGVMVDFVIEFSGNNDYCSDPINS